jgi:hypothetical protein
VRVHGKDVQARLAKALGHGLKRAQAAKDVRAGIGVDDVLALLAATFHAAKRSGSSPAKLFAIVCAGLRT